MAETASDACRNCAQPLGAPRPRYCPQCGQETHLRPPTLLEFAQQMGGAVLSTEGSLWRTLTLLVRRPGELTRQYFAGRRRHYVLPVRLYLTTSVVALFLLRVATPWSPDLQIRFDDDASPEAIAKIEDAVRRVEEAAGASPEQVKAKVAEAVRKARAAIEAEGKKADGETAAGPAAKAERKSDKDADANADSADAFECNDLPDWVCERLKRRHTNDPEEIRKLSKELNERLIANLGTMMFLLLPSFALLTKLAWVNRGLRYTEHLVFALHLHAFWFLLLPLTLFQVGWLTAVAFVWSAVYALLALRRVFGGNGWLRFARAAVVAIAYLTTLGIAFAGMGFFVLLT